MYRLANENNNSAGASHLFVHFFGFTARLRWFHVLWTAEVYKTSDYQFFSLFLNLSAVPKKPTRGHLPTFDIFTYLEKTWQNLKKTRINFKSDVFPVVAVIDAEAPSWLLLCLATGSYFSPAFFNVEPSISWERMCWDRWTSGLFLPFVLGVVSGDERQKLPGWF